MWEIIQQFFMDGSFFRRAMRGFLGAGGVVLAANNGKLPDTKEAWLAFFAGVIGLMMRSDTTDQVKDTRQTVAYVKDVKAVAEVKDQMAVEYVKDQMAAEYVKDRVGTGS